MASNYQLPKLSEISRCRMCWFKVTQNHPVWTGPSTSYNLITPVSPKIPRLSRPKESARLRICLVHSNWPKHMGWSWASWTTSGFGERWEVHEVDRTRSMRETSALRPQAYFAKLLVKGPTCVICFWVIWEYLRSLFTQWSRIFGWCLWSKYKTPKYRPTDLACLRDLQEIPRIQATNATNGTKILLLASNEVCGHAALHGHPQWFSLQPSVWDLRQGPEGRTRTRQQWIVLVTSKMWI